MTNIPFHLVNDIIMMSRPKPNPVIHQLKHLISEYESDKEELYDDITDASIIDWFSTNFYIYTSGDRNYDSSYYSSDND